MSCTYQIRLRWLIFVSAISCTWSILSLSATCAAQDAAAADGAVADSAVESDDADASPQSNRLFELRIYTTHEGRLQALHDRFRDHTNRLFEKHGMELVGYWTPTDGEESQNTLIYILAYPNREAREASWRGFLNDPVWKRVFTESQQDGKIVEKVESKFMVPTDYSPIH